MTGESVDARYLWAAFVVLFAVIAAASVLPVRPIVVVFPLWGVVVLGATGVALVVAVGAVALGWPAAENRNENGTGNGDRDHLDRNAGRERSDRR